MKLPISSSNHSIRSAVRKLRAAPMADRIQLLVKAKLMSQEEADRAKRRLAEADAARS